MNKKFTPWLEEQIQSLLSADSLDDLVEGLSKSSKQLGFDHFSYGIRVSFPLSFDTIKLIDNYSEEWRDKYHSQNYLAIDPTVQHGVKITQPVIWSESLFSRARPFWDDANSFGLVHGWSQSSHSVGGISGMLTLARSSEPLKDIELLCKTPLLVWFNQIAHTALETQLLPEKDKSQVRLTVRETEIIRWTALGKTAFEISIILGISENTVLFHLKNIIAKFNANNKISAAVQAALLGFL